MVVTAGRPVPAAPTPGAVPPWLATPVPLNGQPSAGPFFFLGTHNVHWLGFDDAPPLFISRRRLDRIRPASWPTATGVWAMDSGGFTVLNSAAATWDLTPAEYVDTVRRAADTIGNLAWAAPMDWMCEPAVVARVAKAGTAAAALGRSTPRGVLDHQILTVRNYLQLRELLDRPGDPLVIPVVQGWTAQQYADCVAMYDAVGVNLADAPLVGVGSVCRRDADTAILATLGLLGELGVQRIHGFGLKGSALTLGGHRLTSADSTAWSYSARMARKPIIDGHTHRHCGNCYEAAIAWRDRRLGRIHANTTALRAGLATVEQWIADGVWDNPFSGAA